VPKSPAELVGMLELADFLTDLPKRLKALQRHVTSEVAIAFNEKLKATAPNDPLLGNYAKDMHVAQVEGGVHDAYASVCAAKVVKIRDLDPATTVLYLRHPDAEPRDSIYSYLAAFHPFDVGLFPVGIPIDMVYLVARTVSPAEVALVRQRNIKDRQKLNHAIEKAKVRGVQVDNVDLGEAKALTDIAFLVIRKELGIGMSKKPHWRQALRMIGAGSTLKGIVASKTVSRLISGRYRGFDKLGMLSDKATDQQMKSTKQFQEKILGG